MNTDPSNHTHTTPATSAAPEASRSNGNLPPTVFASAVDLPKAPAEAIDPDFLLRFNDEEIPFWRPTLGYTAQAIGWRWVFLFPALTVVVWLPLWLIFHSRALMYAAPHLIFLWGFSLAVVISIVEEAVKHGVRRRLEPFCIHCGYNVEGLGDEGRCPECGRLFLRSLIDEFRKDPEFFAHRCRKAKSHPPALVFAAGMGPTPDDGTR